MRIMYVEDNAVNLGLVRRIAKMGNHEVISFSNGPDALKALETEPIDLILMDIELEGEMNGLEVVEILRERGDERPIVAVTAYAMAGDKERILAAGCNAYLPKPLPVAQFLNILAKYDPEMGGLRGAHSSTMRLRDQKAAQKAAADAQADPQKTSGQPAETEQTTAASTAKTEDAAPQAAEPSAAAETKTPAKTEKTAEPSAAKTEDAKPATPQPQAKSTPTPEGTAGEKPVSPDKPSSDQTPAPPTASAAEDAEDAKDAKETPAADAADQSPAKEPDQPAAAQAEAASPDGGTTPEPDTSPESVSPDKPDKDAKDKKDANNDAGAASTPQDASQTEPSL